MATFEKIVEIVNEDEGFVKLIQDTTGNESLTSLGFDSLDVLMLAYSIGEEYGIELEINKHHNLLDIVDMVNLSVSGEKA